MKRHLAGLILCLFATASYAQSTITYNVTFDTFYAASGSFVPDLMEFETDPINMTGTVVLTAVASGTQLTGGNDMNYVTLNGSWNSVFAFNPPNTQQVYTYDNAKFGLFSPTGYFANDFVAPAPQFISTGTSTLGELSDFGPADLYPDTSMPPDGIGDCPLLDFGGIANCASAAPQIDFAPGTTVFNGTDSNFPTLADAGWHPLVEGSATQETLNGGAPLTDLSHDNGLDGFYFEGGLDTNVPGAIVPGGIVRIVMTSASGNTMYVLEGTTTLIPVPAAVWLFGSALGLLGWVRRRTTV